LEGSAVPILELDIDQLPVVVTAATDLL